MYPLAHAATPPLSVPLTLALALVASACVHGFARRTGTLAGATARWQLASLLAGLCLLWLAVASPLADLDHQRLYFHMLQHLVLMNVAAPLLLLGAPLQTLAAGFPFLRTGTQGHFGAAPVRALARLLTHPAFSWLVGTGVVVGWHVPFVFERTLHSGGWHAVQHASFLFAGLLFWWPVVLPWPAVARWPGWAMVAYLFFATLPCDVLSALLAFSGRVLYPHYLLAQTPGGLSPLADQECAGALMWLFVTVSYLVPAVLIALQLLSPRRTPVREAAVL